MLEGAPGITQQGHHAPASAGTFGGPAPLLGPRPAGSGREGSGCLPAAGFMHV